MYVCVCKTDKEEGNSILLVKSQKKINVCETCHMGENCSKM